MEREYGTLLTWFTMKLTLSKKPTDCHKMKLFEFLGMSQVMKDLAT